MSIHFSYFNVLNWSIFPFDLRIMSTSKFSTPKKRNIVKNVNSESTAKTVSSGSTSSSIKKSIRTINLQTDSDEDDPNVSDNEDTFSISDIKWSNWDEVKRGVKYINHDWDDDEIEELDINEGYGIIFGSMTIQCPNGKMLTLAWRLVVRFLVRILFRTKR